GSYGPALSADGRYVVFGSDATDLVARDTNGVPDVFLRDLRAGTTVRVSLSAGGRQANDHSYQGAVTPDGRQVAFASGATNLVPGDTNGVIDVFLRRLRP
ncbi:TolB family protein, partial [Micromonospora humida]